MHDRRITLGAAVLIAGLATSALNAEPEANPFIGTWRMNVPKSHFDPGPPPQSETITIEPHPEGTRTTAKGIEADGKAREMSMIVIYDGKDRPLPYRSPWFDTIARFRMDAYRVGTAYRKDGKVVKTYTNIVSTDGRELTIVAEGIDEKGRQAKNIKVYERQP